MPITRKGFTLIELIVTISILGILATVAIPFCLKSFKRMESQTISSHIMSFLQNSKQEALIYQKSIIACIANEQLQCVSSGGTHLISFIDNNDNQSFEAATDKLNQKTDLSVNFGHLISAISLNKTYIALKPDSGRPIGYMGSIKYCPEDGDTLNMFKVTFNKVGIIKYRKNADEATQCT